MKVARCNVLVSDMGGQVNTQEVEEIEHCDPSKIVIGYRFRKDIGDLEPLAKSIAQIGLLHPIGIDGAMRLIFGERRLRAVRDVLKLDTIKCRIVNLDAINALVAEQDENELHKSFTPSERVAIADAIKARTEEKRGGDRRSSEFQSGQLATLKTRDHAAKAAGFKSTQEYRRAAKVVEKGDPKLVEMMDRGDVAVSTAAVVAALPKNEQATIVAGGPAAVKRVVRRGPAVKPEVQEVSPSKLKVLPKLGPPCRGLQMARLAILNLEEIRPDDVERLPAFDLVKKWVADHE